MVRPAILRSKATTKAILQAQDRLQQAKGNQDCQMTINVVCKCIKKFIKCSESYNAESMGNGVQRATKDNGFCEGDRQACLPSRHLEVVNKGHLGTECHRRLSNTFDREPPSISKAPRKCVFKRAGSSSVRGSGLPSAEGSHLSCHRGHRGFYSTIFLVPKKNGQMRPVINLKCLNQWVEAPHFKMEGIATLRDLFRSGDWMMKVDLKDAYFTIPIHLHHQQFLRFRVEELCYQFTCLPFGLSCAPHSPR